MRIPPAASGRRFLSTIMLLAGVFFAFGTTVHAQAPTITAVSAPRQVVTAGQSVTLSVTATGATSYQWKRNGLPIGGATNTSYVINNASPLAHDGWYQAVASNSSGSVTSATVFVLCAPTATEVIAWGMVPSDMPTLLAGVSNIISFSAARASDRVLALRTDGTILTTGSPVPIDLGSVVAVSMGASHSVALKADGTVAVWGNNDWGQGNIPAGLGSVVAISAGTDHTLALKADGTVVAFGNPLYGATTVPAGLANVVAIAAGESFNLALKADGTVIGWGNNSSGRSSVPTNLSNVMAIGAGRTHSLALKSDGTVAGWGENGWGQATAPGSATAVVAIAAGNAHSLALRANGSLVGWGYSTTGGVTIPGGLNSVFRVEAGPDFSAAIRNASGDTAPSITVQPANINAFAGQEVTLSAAISAGTSFLRYQWRKNGTPIGGATSAALKLPRIAVSDAGNYDVVVTARLGSVTSATAVVTVNPASALTLSATGRQLLTAGQNFTIISSTALPGTVSYQWRRNGVAIAGATSPSLSLANATWRHAGAYQLVATNSAGPFVAEAVFVAVATPTQVFGWDGPSIPPDLSNVIAVAAGDNHSLALLADGTMRAWGDNVYGQLNIPAGLNNVVAIAASSTHSMALRADGTVATWGSINYTPTGLSSVIAISAGSATAMAVKADGDVVVWGNGSVATDTPAGLNAIGVASTLGARVAVRVDGTVVGWGAGPLTDIPSGLNGVIAVSAGSDDHGLALKSDGRVVGWGTNVNGQASIPSDLTNVIGIAAGAGVSYAVKSDGTFVRWGAPVYGIPAGVDPLIMVSTRYNGVLALRDASSDAAPAITIQPNNRTAVIGTNATFSVTATGSPLPSYQWQRQPSGSSGFTNLSEGGNFFFTTTANLSVTASSLAMSGDQFRCVVTNGVGSPATSNAATLTVVQAPTITSANAATFAGGTGGSFTVTATGTPAPTFSVVGGTFPSWATIHPTTGVISGTPPDAIGSPFTFTVQASNSVSSVTQSFTLTVTPVKLLSNFSVRMNVPLEGLEGRFRISGLGSKTVLIRGTGPMLSVFGVSGVLADPRLDLTNAVTGDLVASNDNWETSSAPMFIAAGAFPFSTNSRDSAIVATLPAGNYSVKLSGVGGTTGEALYEVYDVGGGAVISYFGFRAPLNPGATMVTGFSVSAPTARSILVRAVGPSLSMPGALADPSLTLYNGLSAILSNDNWGGFLSLATAANAAGAFRLASTDSKDSALSTSLAPGSYSAQVFGVGNTGGLVLVEVYDVDPIPVVSAPYFLASPTPQVVFANTNVSLSALAAGSYVMAYQWLKNGVEVPGATNATLTLNSAQVADSGTYSVVATNTAGSATSQSALLTVNAVPAPSIPTATAPGTVNVGLPAIFTVTATGIGPLTYQWRKDGVPISGATNSTLSIGSVQLSDSGSYQCLVTNAGGTTTTTGLILNVVAIPPTITVQPVGGSLSVGGSILLSVTATGSPALTYQWRRNGITLFGATSSTFGIPNAQTWDNGDYEVTVTSPYGSTTSVPVHLTVVARPVSISARVVIGSGEPAIATFTVEGTTAKNLLLRAVGPGITPFGFNNVVPDPQLEVFDAAGNVLANNNDWSSASNAAAISSTTAAVGAFGLAAGSRDSAVFQAFAPGSYTVRVTGNGGIGGVAFLELYDADLPTNGSRVPFVAVRARVAPGEAIMIGGLASNGRGVRSYLIRAVGPGLGLTGSFANPSLLVLRENALVANGDGWDAVASDGLAVTNASARVAAFPLTAGSHDAALVVTGNLHAGAHTVQVGGNSGAGIVLLELHDLDASRPTAFAPVVVSPPLPQAVAAGGAISLAARAHGTPPLSYQWRRDGLNLAGATGQTLAIPSAQLADGGLYSVAVTNSVGTATSLAAQVTVGGASGAISATHASVESGYQPGGTITIANTLVFSGAVTGLGWQVALPAGWSFVSDSGSAGDIKPVAGATGTLEWAWTTPPASPVTFSYRVNVPAGESGAKSLTATAIVRDGTNAEVLIVAPYPLVINPSLRYHSADTNLDERISLLELTRVIELYNTRNGTVRTGAYKVDPSGEDGFASDAVRLVAEPATLTRYHSGDTQGATAGTPPDGKLGLLELTRVIELYNYRSGTVRTGQYHPQPGTEDGFAPGP